MRKTKYTLIPLKNNALQEAGIPLSIWTLRDWRKKGEYQELFIKVGKRVFLVLERWNEIVEQSIPKTKKRKSKGK